MSDLIKRSDAIKALEREKSDWNNDYNVPIDNCIKRLKKVKSADTDISEYSDKLWRNAYERGKADRPQGEWKHLKGDEWLCSECGHVIWTEASWEHPLERGKDYCEHCGAKMKGTDDGRFNQEV